MSGVLFLSILSFWDILITEVQLFCFFCILCFTSLKRFCFTSLTCFCSVISEHIVFFRRSHYGGVRNPTPDYPDPYQCHVGNWGEIVFFFLFVFVFIFSFVCVFVFVFVRNLTRARISWFFVSVPCWKLMQNCIFLLICKLCLYFY